jgi:energy-coupling factor transporter ATP-binding protein EcfA2
MVSPVSKASAKIPYPPCVEWGVDTTTRFAIKTRGLRKHFGEITAVDGLDLEVEAGSFFGFLGPNGAGTSTTIRILTGMLLPTAGTASILGHDIVDDAVNAKKIMGVVSEDGAVFERPNGAGDTSFDPSRLLRFPLSRRRIYQLSLISEFFSKIHAIWLVVSTFAIEGLVVWSVIRGLPQPEVSFTGVVVFASTIVLMTVVGNVTSIAFPVHRPIASAISAASPVGTLVVIGCLLMGVVIAGAATLGAVLTGTPGLQPVIALGFLGLVTVI